MLRSLPLLHIYSVVMSVIGLPYDRNVPKYMTVCGLPSHSRSSPALLPLHRSSDGRGILSYGSLNLMGSNLFRNIYASGSGDGRSVCVESTTQNMLFYREE